MESIKRSDVNEQWAHSGIVEAGDFAFISYCVCNIGQPVENQINGAMDHLEKRLESIGLTLGSVVKLDCMFRDVWNTPIMENIPQGNQYKRNLPMLGDKKVFCFNLTR